MFYEKLGGSASDEFLKLPSANSYNHILESEALKKSINKSHISGMPNSENKIESNYIDKNKPFGLSLVRFGSYDFFIMENFYLDQINNRDKKNKIKNSSSILLNEQVNINSIKY